MTSDEVWARLGLEPTTDRSAIRRAYAAQLKRMNPEDDPGGFIALRAAYDAALSGAHAHFPVVVAGPVETRPTGYPEPEQWEGEPWETDLQEIEVQEVAREREAEEREAPEREAPEREPQEREAEEHEAQERELREPEHREPDAEQLERRPPLWTRRRHSVAPEPAPHERLIAGLERLLQDGAGPEAQEAALEALLTSPSMELLAVQIRVEAALAGLIAAYLPASDPLVARAVETFAWSADSDAAEDTDAARVVAARRVDLQHLSQLQARSRADRRALAMLANPPDARGAWTLALWPGRAVRLAQLVRDLQENHPGLALNFPPAALDTWAERLTRPRLSAVGVWIVMVGALLVGAVFLFSPDRTGLASLSAAVEIWLALSLGGLGVLLAYWLVLQWPRWLWLNRWSASASPWVAHGWAALAAVTFVAGFVLPAAPWAIALTGLGAAAVALWGWTTGRRFTASPSLFPPLARWAGRNAGLAVLLYQLTMYGHAPTAALAALAIVGPALATGFAEADLARLWAQEVVGIRRRLVLAALMVAAFGITAWAVREADRQTSQRLLAAIALLAFAQRLPAAAAPPTRRDLNLSAHPRLTMFGFIICFLVLSSMGKAGTGLVALTLPAGALAGLLIAWTREPPLRLWPLRRSPPG